MEDLKYPIGTYNPPSTIDRQQIKSWIEAIEQLPEKISRAVASLTAEQLNTPYRPGGWTVRQVVHHLPDSHINSYIRFHWTLTENTPRIKAYDEKTWAALVYQDQVPVRVSLDLLRAVHARWVILLHTLTDEDLERRFIHPEDGHSYTLRYTIGNYAWHGNHHLAHITTLKKRMGW